MIENDYFTEAELKCKCCGELKFKDETLRRLIAVREQLREPMIISSGYRCEAYNSQIGATQTHASGQAVDVVCSGATALSLVGWAVRAGFTGIGIKQKGEHAQRFIHLDDLEPDYAPRPTIWSY